MIGNKHKTHKYKLLYYRFVKKVSIYLTIDVQGERETTEPPSTDWASVNIESRMTHNHHITLHR